MPTFSASKVVAALPSPLAPDRVYYVRTGIGFDTYITDTNAIAYKANANAGDVANLITQAGDAFMSEDGANLLVA